MFLLALAGQRADAKLRIELNEFLNLFLCFMWIYSVLRVRQLITAGALVEGQGLTVKQVVRVTGACF